MGNITMWPERQFVRVGDTARLVACAWPPFPYRYTWDFGTEDAAARVGGPEATFTYWDSGSYLVTVTVSNNISAANDSALVEVQEPVDLTGIRVNGSHVLELQQPYLFSAVGRGHPATYLWELGDGRRLQGPAVTHAYSSTGCFPVRVSGWNEVSRGEAQLNVTVQQRVRGLSVNASRTVVYPLSRVAPTVCGQTLRTWCWMGASPMTPTWRTVTRRHSASTGPAWPRHRSVIWRGNRSPNPP